jgi:hypothetical protein
MFLTSFRKKIIKIQFFSLKYQKNHLILFKLIKQ